MLSHVLPGVSSRPARGVRPAVTVIAVTFILLIVGCAGPPPDAQSGAAPQQTPDPCAWVGTLVYNGFPQRAVARIEELAKESRADATKVCPAQLAAATRAVDEAEDLASRAKDLAPSPEADELARQALVKDLDNAVAAAILSPSTLTCQKATHLLATGFPQHATALIDAANTQLPADAAKLCTEAYTAAIAAREEAQRLALAAQALKPTDLPEAKKIASQALAFDRENTVAQEIVATSDPTNWQSYLAQWTDLSEGLLTPASGLLVPAASLALTLMVIARLLVIVPFGRFGRSRAGAARLRVGLGLSAILAGSAAVVALISTAGAPPLGLTEEQAWTWAWVAFGVCGVGVLMLAWGLATRLRIGVTAHKLDGADPAGAAHVLALLDELGATPPRGLEKPQGADVTALDSALDAISDHPVGKALKAILAAVTGWLPWQVRVDEDSDGAIAVAISRNGYTKASAVIDLTALGVAPTKTDTTNTADGKQAVKVDPHRFVAAFVLTTLDKYHQGFDGLCGATDWRSLGMHDVATTDFKNDLPRSKELLSKAVDIDGNNWLAQVALAYARWRKATKAEDLTRYITWLEQAITNASRNDQPATFGRPPSVGQAKPGFEHLRLRMRASLTAARVNHAYAEAVDAIPLNLDLARRALVMQCADLALARETKPHDEWLVLSRARAAAVALQWDGAPAIDQRQIEGTQEYSANIPADLRLNSRQELELITPGARGERDQGRIATKVNANLSEWEKLPRTPSIHYLRGCSRASQGNNSKAVDEFWQAHDDPELASWIHDDPQLEAFRHNDLYRQNFLGKPRSELLELAPFEPMRPALERLGMRHPSAWADLDHRRTYTLAKGIPATTGQVRSMANLAEIALSLKTEPALAPLHLEILASLIDDDLTSARRIKQRVQHNANLNTLMDKLRTVIVKFVDKNQQANAAGALERWLRSV